MAKRYFITFANRGYMKTDRIIEQTKKFNIFDSVESLDETYIPEFIEKHYNFIVSHPIGFGSFIWKPKIIYDKLLSIDDNDILMYADAGIHMNVNGKQRFLEYLDMLDTYKIITFLTSNFYKANNFVKADAVMSYYPEFNNELRQYLYAGVMIIKKTSETIKLISEWLELCERYDFLENKPSVSYPDIPSYIGQDLDNGLFALTVYKNKEIVKFIDPHEFNVYREDGNQIQNNRDWSKLDKYPIQCRRDRPPRSSNESPKNIQFNIMKGLFTNR